jgi:hypothetical protein
MGNKSELQNPKSETISNAQNSNFLLIDIYDCLKGFVIIGKFIVFEF